jgi:hypothetical protein
MDRRPRFRAADQECRAKSLLLGKGAVLAHRLAPPLVAESTNASSGPAGRAARRPLLGSCKAALRGVRPGRTAGSTSAGRLAALSNLAVRRVCVRLRHLDPRLEFWSTLTGVKSRRITVGSPLPPSPERQGTIRRWGVGPRVDVFGVTTAEQVRDIFHTGRPIIGLTVSGQRTEAR